MRLRELGITIGRLDPGKYNAITDVDGVLVGHKTIIKGESKEKDQISGIARTGVTVVYPHSNIWTEPIYAGTFILNGNGEMTGMAWIEESGLLYSPIGLTNTHSVGIYRDTMIKYFKRRPESTNAWMLPVVAETWDGYLSDINGMHVSIDDILAVLDDVSSGPVKEGNVGGGTGMVCFGFKGGIGTSSRKVVLGGETYTIGILVQTNYGLRHQLTVNGIPVGREINTTEVPGREDQIDPYIRDAKQESGSIIIIIATDVPLLPDQCKRLAKRASLGLARTGSIGANNSGDIFIAFSTGNIYRELLGNQDKTIHSVRTVGPETMSNLFEAVIEATEESILNALCSAETMRGIKGRTIHALPLQRLKEVMDKYQIHEH